MVSNVAAFVKTLPKPRNNTDLMGQCKSMDPSTLLVLQLVPLFSRIFVKIVVRLSMRILSVFSKLQSS